MEISILLVLVLYKDMSVSQRSVHIKINKLFDSRTLNKRMPKLRQMSPMCKCHCTTLHQNNLASSGFNDTSENKSSTQTSTESAASVSVFTTNSSEPAKFTLPHPTLIMIGQVLVESTSGQRAYARALQDTCATLSLITSKLAHQLQFPKEPCSLSLTGEIGTMNGNTSHMVSFLQIFIAKILSSMCKLK